MRKLILFLLLLTPFGLKAQTTVNGRIMTGELATRPTSCAVADQFNTTDGHGAFLCNPTPNTWQPIGGGGTNYQTVEQAGVPLIQQAALNFPAYMTCIDNPSNLSTDCTPDIMVGAGASHSAGLVPDPGPTDNHFPLCQNGQFSSDCQVAVGTLPNPVLTGSIAGGAPWRLGVDTVFAGANPYVDARYYGVRALSPNIPPATPGITANINSGSSTASISSASTFQDGDGVVIWGAGATNAMSTPGAPTVTPSVAASYTGSLLDVAAPAGGATPYCYQVVARDVNGGLTAASTETCTATGAATLGLNTNTVSTITMANNVISVVTTAPHGLAVGALFNMQGVSAGVGFGPHSDNPYNGWFIVDTKADNTHFTYKVLSDTRADSPATGTGGTISYWQNNRITWTAVTGAFQYYIYGRVTGGTKTLIGISWPQNAALAGDVTYLAFDDFGPVVSTVASKPIYIPTNPPGAATNDMLITTISSGAGTTTLTLAGTAGQTVTGANILFDDAKTLLAAATAANSGGSSVVLAATTDTYVFNSPVTIPSATSVIQRGPVQVNETINLTGVSWVGDTEKGTYPSFAYSPAVPFNISTANPGIYTTGDANFYNLTIAQLGASANGANMVVMDTPSAIPAATLENINFVLGTTTDYSNIAFIARGTQVASGSVWNFKNILLLTTQNGPTTLTACFPSMYINNGGDVQFNNLFFSGKGLLYRPPVSASYLKADAFYTQGNYEPLFAFSNTNGALTNLNVQLKTGIMDTTVVPIVANLGGLRLNVNMEGVLDAASAITGVPYATVSGNTMGFSNNSGTENMTGLVSAIDGVFGQTAGFPLKTMNSSMVLGRGYSIFAQGITPSIPTCGTPTSGTGPAAGTWYYAYAPVYANGSEGKFSLACNVTSSGITDLTIPLTWTAVDGAIGYNIYRGAAANSMVQLSCFRPATGTNSYNDASASACGQSVPDTASGGPAGIQNGKVWANDFVMGATTTAPTGQGLTIHSYMDSTLNWPSFKTNSNVAYQYLGVHGPITSGHSACFDSNVFASMVDCPGGGGGSSANPALQNSVAFYPDPGTATTIGGVNGLTTPNGVTQFWTTTATGGIAGPPTPTLGGVIPTADASTSYIVVDTDRNSLRHFTAATPVAVTLPDASTWGSNPTFAFCVDGGGTVTFTPDAPSVISYWTGAVFTSAASSMSLTTGECITLFTDNVDYFASLRPGSAGNVTGNSLTGGQLIVGNGGSAITVGNLTGDVTTVAGTATTLATVNANVGSFTAANITVNGKGLVTAASNGALGFPLTVTGGTTGHLPYFSNSTTLADAGTNIIWDPANRIFQLGNPGASAGVLKFGNLAGGYATLTSTNVATNDAFTLPQAITTSGNILMTNNNHTATTANFIINMAAADATASAFVLPYGATAGGTGGSMGYDSGNSNFHVRNGADKILAPLAAGFVSGHCAQPTASAGKWELVDLGAACSAGGSGTVNIGTLPRLAYYDTSTAAVSDTGANLTWTSPVLTIGASASTTGQLKLASSTATGSVILTPASAASDFTVTIPAAADTLVNLASIQSLTNKTINASSNTLSNITGAMMTNNTVTATQLASSLSLVSPNINAATATSLIATGIVDGTTPMTVTSSTPITLGGGTYSSGYTINEHATAGTAITYTLPIAAAGKQYCVANGYNGSAANTGVLTVATSGAGQFIIFTDGTLTATGGNITSGGAGGDAACVVGVDTTHWILYVNRGTWTKH